MGEQKSGVGIVATTPGDSESHSGHIATRMMVAIFLHFHDEVHIFTRSTAVMEFDDDRVYVHRYTKPMADSPVDRRLLGQLLYQIKYGIGIFRKRRSINLIFVSSSGTLFIIIAARLARVFTVYRIGGALYQQQPTSMLSQKFWKEFLKAVEKATYLFAESIIVISKIQMDDLQLGSTRDKTHVWNHYYFDLDRFDVHTTYSGRDNVIGHVGISKVKGTGKFLRSLKEVDSELIDQVIVIGNGPNMEEYQSLAVGEDYEVRFTGRVDRNKMAEKFNHMKLLVACSESEGVPKVILEAMACGTPVLATDVGGVSDYIIPEQTGFLLENNNPDTISTVIERALSQTNSSRISQNSRDKIEKEFSQRSVIKAYTEFLSDHTPIEPKKSREADGNLP